MPFYKLAFGALAVLLAFLGYKAFVSLPETYVNQAESAGKKILLQENRLKTNRAKFDRIKKSTEWAFLAPYSEKYDWPQQFNEAEKHLAIAKKTYDEKITPIIDNDHQDDIPVIVPLLALANKEVQLSKKASEYPVNRANFILDGRTNKNKYFKHSQELLKKADKMSLVFSEKAEKSISTHPHKKDDINIKLSGLADLLGKVEKDFAIVSKEHNANATDYVVFVDTYVQLKNNQSALIESLESNTKLLIQLDKSYVKVLSDQKVDYFVTIGRASWCEGEYCGDGDTTRYPPVKVDENTFEFFDSSTAALIARKGSNWGSSSFKLYIPSNRWDALRVNPGYRLNNSYNYSEYWVDNTNAKTYHKYSLIEGGKVTDQGWVEVSNDKFWKNYNHLGMAINTKPLGHYESEMITTPEPVGMATIARPTLTNGRAVGSNQYGEWRHSNGTSFWYYYGMYRLMGDFGGSRRYSYGDWNGYNSYARNRTYYGSNNQYGTYGSSTYSNSRYSNSSFARRNPSAMSEARTHRNSKISSSIRGAGSSSRGKGPSGSGK